MRETTLTNAAQSPRGDLALAGAVFLVALAARLLFLFTSPDRDWPHSVFHEGDAIMWVDWAIAIDRGQPFNFDLPIHPPGVAYPIAYLYSGVRSHDFAGMKMLWCAMSAAACGLTYLACVGAGMPRRVGVIAAMLLCFSFGQYVLATSLNSETPYVFLLAAAVLVTQRVMRRPTRWSVATLGILQGIAMLLRPEHPLLLAMWVAWMLIARPPASRPEATPRLPLCARVTSSAFMVVIALVVCVPWTSHAILSVRRFNTIELDPIKYNLAPIVWTEDGRAALNALPAFARQDNFQFICDWAQRQRLRQIAASDVRRFFTDVFGWTPTTLSPMVLISNQGPFSFALANHPQSDGGFSRIALADSMMGADPKFAFAYPPHNRIFNDGWRVGWNFIIEDPRAWLTLAGRKFQRFGDGLSQGFGAANLPLGREGVRHRVDMLTVPGATARVWQITMLALIVAGAALGFARRMPIGLWLLIIVNKVIITALFYGYARQAASIAPAFFVLTAITLDSLLLPIDRRWPAWLHWQRAIVIGVCVAMLALDFPCRRGDEADRIVLGPFEPRADLGSGAFTSYGEIEIREAP